MRLPSPTPAVLIAVALTIALLSKYRRARSIARLVWVALGASSVDRSTSSAQHAARHLLHLAGGRRAAGLLLLRGPVSVRAAA